MFKTTHRVIATLLGVEMMAQLFVTTTPPTTTFTVFTTTTATTLATTIATTTITTAITFLKRVVGDMIAITMMIVRVKSECDSEAGVNHVARVV
mmetsp:Transcript_27830/g.46556  ORF Transcript_27830/g.46556 Transcript_27830/m.46556 type:complete len:94 (-) Transcript_27830:481-762(-)